MNRNEAILRIKDIIKHFGGIAACDRTTMDVKEGSITALIGPNGAGKTTLFHIVSGFYKPEHGSVEFLGQSIERKTPHAIAKGGLVRTFQITKALTRMTVLENMMLAAPRQPGEHLWRLFVTPGRIRAREKDIEERAREILRLVQLERLANDYAGTLSGGQRKLLEFGRTLMTQPEMIMLDEPMAGINPTLGRQLLEHMQRLREKEGLTFLFIEHDMEVVVAVSDRVIVMNEGRVISEGTPEEVRDDQEVIDAYLGTMTSAGGMSHRDA